MFIYNGGSSSILPCWHSKYLRIKIIFTYHILIQKTSSCETYKFQCIQEETLEGNSKNFWEQNLKFADEIYDYKFHTISVTFRTLKFTSLHLTSPKKTIKMECQPAEDLIFRFLFIYFYFVKIWNKSQYKIKGVG